MSKPTSTESDAATPAMLEDSLLPFSFPAVERKKVTAAFDGGRMTSDGGVMLLAAVEKQLGLADRLASQVADPRNPLLVTHSVADILRARMLAIACGYEDADDLDHLRTDPGSSWPADGCRTAAQICAPSRPCHDGRTHLRCARSCA